LSFIGSANAVLPYSRVAHYGTPQIPDISQPAALDIAASIHFPSDHPLDEWAALQCNAPNAMLLPALKVKEFHFSCSPEAVLASMLSASVISLEHADTADARALITELEAHLAPLYPVESRPRL